MENPFYLFFLAPFLVDIHDKIKEISGIKRQRRLRRKLMRRKISKKRRNQLQKDTGVTN